VKKRNLIRESEKEKESEIFSGFWSSFSISDNGNYVK
jgi:hypothetical protein